MIELIFLTALQMKHTYSKEGLVSELLLQHFNSSEYLKLYGKSRCNQRCWWVRIFRTQLAKMRVGPGPPAPLISSLKIIEESSKFFFFKVALLLTVACDRKVGFQKLLHHLTRDVDPDPNPRVGSDPTLN